MLEWLRKAVQGVLIWLLLFINGGKLPPELMPPINFPDIDWSALAGQGNQLQVNVPASLDAAARSAKLPRTKALPSASSLAAGSKLIPASMGGLSGLAGDSTALLGALAGGMGNAKAALDPSIRIVNPSGVPREMLGGVNPWRSKGGRPGANTVVTEIVGAAPVEGRGATLGVILLGAGALAVAGYVVVRRRR